MNSPFWSRLREARLGRALLIFGGVGWAVLEATGFFVDEFGLPHWVLTATLVLLFVGLLVLLITALVQASSAMSERAAEGGPTAWEIDLDDIKESVASGRLPRLTWARAFLAGIVAFSLFFGFAGLYVLLTTPRDATLPAVGTAARQGPAIAVLPFRVAGPDADLWREGMVDLFYNNLDGVAGLRAIDPPAVLSRWREALGDEAGTSDAQAALQIARDVGADYALLGNMVGSESQVRITAEVHDLRTGRLQRTQVEGSPDSILALVDGLCLEILRGGLLPANAELPELDLSRVTTPSLPALKAFLEGEQLYRRSRFREAIAQFDRAVEADSTFAIVYYRISQAYGWVDPFSPRSAENAARAVELADRLPERERLLVRARADLESVRVRGIERLEEFTSRYPDDIEGWNLLGDIYHHAGQRRLLPREAAKGAFQRSLEMDPDFGPTYIHLIDYALVEQDTARARELIRRHRAIDPESPHARGFALVEALALGDSTARAQAEAALDTVAPDALVSAFSRFYWSANFYPEQGLAVAEALLDPRNPRAARRFGVIGLVRANLARGRVGQAREAARAGAELVSGAAGETYAAMLDVLWYLAGYADAEAANQAAAFLAADTFMFGGFFAGALAANQERWDDLERQIEAYRAREARAVAEGDETRAADARAYVTVLEGYRSLRDGEFQSALQLIEQAAPLVPDPTAGAYLNFDLGKLALELGDLEKAERYFQSLQFYVQMDGTSLLTVLTEYYLGVTYEAMGNVERARLHFARFNRWMEDADPELALLSERGRQALERLTREPVS